MLGSEAEHAYWGKLARTFHGDALLLVNLLHIVESPIAVRKESHRVLSSDGRTVTVDVTGHCMSLLKKILPIAFLCLTIGYSAVVVVPYFIVKVILIIIAICVSMHVLVLPTLEPSAG